MSGNGSLPTNDLENEVLEDTNTGSDENAVQNTHEEPKETGLPVEEDKKEVKSSHLEELKELQGLSHLTDEEYMERVRQSKANNQKQKDSKQESKPNEEVAKLQKKVEEIENTNKEKEFYELCRNTFGFNANQLDEFKDLTRGIPKDSKNNRTFNTIALGIQSKNTSQQPDVKVPDGTPSPKKKEEEKVSITDGIYGPNGIFGKKNRN